MALENKLGITNSAELAREEERLSKKKALELYDASILDGLEAGKFSALAAIHKYLFGEVYDFAGEVRTANLAKGNFRFAPVMYLHTALEHIDTMPQGTFDEIIEKYVEMNIAHPFREGNGRSTRIWLDLLLKKELRQVADWSKVDKDDYLLAMERSPIKDIEIKFLLKNALMEVEDDYDYIIIDTPPALNVLTVNAYVAADGLIVPMAPEILSLLGVSQIRETIDTVRRCYNSRLRVLGILLNKFSLRLVLNRDVLDMAEQIAKQLDSKVFQARIRSAVAVAESPAHGESVLTYAPSTKVARDFRLLLNEITQEYGRFTAPPIR